MIPTPYPYPYMGFGIHQPYRIAYRGDFATSHFQLCAKVLNSEAWRIVEGSQVEQKALVEQLAYFAFELASPSTEIFLKT